MTDDKTFFESKKFTALVIVLGVVLILGIVGAIYHAEVQSMINGIIAFASSHQLSQGVQDAIGKWKGPAQQAAQEVKVLVAQPAAEVASTVEEEIASFDPKDFDPEAFA